MTANASNPREYQKIFHWAETQQDGAIPSFGLRKNDPYEVSLEQPELDDCIVDNE
jgi:homogentisate 1,2-dioxygenase